MRIIRTPSSCDDELELPPPNRCSISARRFSKRATVFLRSSTTVSCIGAIAMVDMIEEER
jgi:hypothetical protein